MDDGERLAGMASNTVDVMGRRKTVKHNGFTAAKRQRFLDVLAETCCVEQALDAADLHSSNIYKRRRHDPVFAAEWLEALAVGYDAIEARVLRYVLNGGEPDGVGHGAEHGADRGGVPTVRGGPGGGMVFGTAPAWVQVALHLLNRHRPTIEGRNRGMKIGKPATPEATDAVLTRRLDQLARVLARKAERQAAIEAAIENAPGRGQATTVLMVADRTGGQCE